VAAALVRVIPVREALAGSGLAPIDAQVLLAHVLDVDRAWLVAHADEALSAQQGDRFTALVARRRAGEPVAYVTGVREFWGLCLRVDRRVLIPRPETETLVECALEALPVGRAVRVLDLGTGCGAVALAIARERPQARVLAVDRSEEALAVARANVEHLKLANVELLQSDWYEALPGEARFDLIVGNPPYVADADRHLAEGDVRFEPASALRAGAQGLDALRIVVAGAPSHLVGSGVVAVEHGFDQAAAVRALLREAGFAGVATRNDLAGLERVSLAHMP
jgi:release factor glutamine methyltransferase